MDIRIIHYKDGVYDVYDRTRDKWLFSSNSADNVFAWLSEKKNVCIEFIDELLNGGKNNGRL